MQKKNNPLQLNLSYNNKSIDFNNSEIFLNIEKMQDKFSYTSARNLQKFDVKKILLPSFNKNLKLSLDKNKKNLESMDEKKFKESLFSLKDESGRFKFYNISVLSSYNMELDYGFSEIEINHGKKYIEIHKLYIFNIYRKMEFNDTLHLEIFKYLFRTNKEIDKIFISVYDKNTDYKQFLIGIGFQFGIAKEKNRMKIDVFVIKRKNLLKNL